MRFRDKKPRQWQNTGHCRTFYTDIDNNNKVSNVKTLIALPSWTKFTGYSPEENMLYRITWTRANVACFHINHVK